MTRATPRQSNRPGLDHRLHDDRECGLEAEHSRASGCELAALVLLGVRSMVGRDAVDDSLGQTLAQRGNITGLTQGRVDLVDRVVRLEP